MDNSIKSFADLGLTPWITKQVASLGLKSPTPIQKACIPNILNGKDCIGAAKTGSGKTFAFALPILQKLSEEPMGYFCLILTPTHELAYQISEQFLVVGKPMGCRVCVVAGGKDQLLESQELQKRPHIVVAMPGRLADHLTGCDTFSFDTLKYLVIDEADRMLDGSFNDCLEIIESRLPKNRINLYFSATINKYIRDSNTFKISDTAFEWSENSDIATVATLDQRYVLCANYDRDMVLIEMLRNYQEGNENANVIIFTNTKQCCQVLSMTLNAVGFSNACIHGYMRHKERVNALSQFKSNQIRILIATDVASRGLDIPNVQLVLNHMLPKDPKEYIHRVGRTARAGRSGLAISIFRFPRDMEFLAAIESAINIKLSEHSINQRMVDRIFLQVSVSKREAELKLDNTGCNEKHDNYRRIMWIRQGLDPDVMMQKYNDEKNEKQKQYKIKSKKPIRETKTANTKILLKKKKIKNQLKTKN